MKLFGWELSRSKQTEKAFLPRDISSVPGNGGWMSIIREPFTGAWQRNIQVSADTVLTHSTVFSCISLIAADVSKLRIRLVALHDDGIWREVKDGTSPFWPVLRKPNRYQTRIQFYGNWTESKLIHGNTYVLKERDQRGIVTRLYVLDPMRVTVLCSPDGSVFYQLDTDRLSGLDNRTVTVPASEIIHDRWNTFNHPLVGISPISAAGLAATQGINIQQSAATLANAGGLPSGILTAPDQIPAEVVDRLERDWSDKYGPHGVKRGEVAVLGAGLEFKPLTMTAVDAQVIDQLKWTSETVVSVFHVPAYKAGIAPAPTYNNIEALNQAYYSDCLQILIEAIELLLDEGIELPKDKDGQQLGTEFDVEWGLFRMDTEGRAKVAAEGIKAGALSPDEARLKYFDLGPVKGGSTPYLQVQNYSLAALAKRDENSFPVTQGLDAPATNGQSPETDGEDDDLARAAATALAPELGLYDFEALPNLRS